VLASRGVRIVADVTLEDVMYDDFDMIILPGGMLGTIDFDQDSRIHAILKRLNQTEKCDLCGTAGSSECGFT
jgi:4-methyl-5(b-hydroxyethyl)-thiazole monophosphate biosynthesis